MHDTSVSVEPLASDEVRTWYAPIDVLPASKRDSLARAWLTSDERERHARFRADRDRTMFLLGRILARTLVARVTGLAPEGWRWHEGPHGRPEMAGVTTPVRFNIAHSGGLVVCAVARTRDVGIDVEDRLRHAATPALIQRCCSPSEVRDLETLDGDGRHQRFFEYWTLKEAFLKARGLGVSVHLADISFALDRPAPAIALSGSLAAWSNAWEFHLTSLGDRHVLAVAVEASATPSRFVIQAMPPDALR